MKVVIPAWNHRISPVFDTAKKVFVAVIENGRIQEKAEYELFEEELFRRADFLQKLSTHVLICGAISKPLEIELNSRGIEVISHICGEIDEVTNAFCRGEISQDRFAMPGCCRKRRFRHRNQNANCHKKGLLK